MKALLVAVAVASVVAAWSTDTDAQIRRPLVGAGQAHTKYSEADAITAADVGELEVAWSWMPNEAPLEEFET